MLYSYLKKRIDPNIKKKLFFEVFKAVGYNVISEDGRSTTMQIHKSPETDTQNNVLSAHNMLYGKGEQTMMKLRSQPIQSRSQLTFLRFSHCQKL